MQPLVVDQLGAFVGKKSERLRVQRKGEVLVEVPLVDLEQVLIVSNGIRTGRDEQDGQDREDTQDGRDWNGLDERAERRFQVGRW